MKRDKRTQLRLYSLNFDNLTIEFEDQWSESYKFIVRKNYTKDIIEQMYLTVADFNAYNKEAKSANMYYIFQAFASEQAARKI